MQDKSLAKEHAALFAAMQKALREEQSAADRVCPLHNSRDKVP